VFCGLVQWLRRSGLARGPYSLEIPDINYEEEWWQHTPLLETNNNNERLWFNSVDTDTIFWVGTDPSASAALHAPNRGGTLSQVPKIQSRYHLASPKKLRSPKLKYEALEISGVGGPFEIKVAYLYITIAVGTLWKRGKPTHCSCYCGPLWKHMT